MFFFLRNDTLILFAFKFLSSLPIRGRKRITNGLKQLPFRSHPVFGHVFIVMNNETDKYSLGSPPHVCAICLFYTRISNIWYQNLVGEEKYRQKKLRVKVFLFIGRKKSVEYRKEISSDSSTLIEEGRKKVLTFLGDWASKEMQGVQLEAINISLKLY